MIFCRAITRSISFNRSCTIFHLHGLPFVSSTLRWTTNPSSSLSSSTSFYSFYHRTTITTDTSTCTTCTNDTFKNINNSSSGSSHLPRPINKLLIANRGEIACRVIRTAHKMGIKTVAVYSDADVDSLHVKMADEAYRIGPPPAIDSYLNQLKILEVAALTHADAIHPGYGFLSENESFALACEGRGIVFVGPPPLAIHAMGSKSASKDIMIKANVPVVPGYHGHEQSFETLAKEALRIGYPVMLKAVLGGGGKGMRIVPSEDELLHSLEACKREALSSFGDDRVLVEKYITRPRHVEIQVFADNHGNVVYLFERDCSVQRRHQKIIEEAPAPGMTEELRSQMGEAAVNCARAVGYRGAGTVEFIFDVDAGNFYFMEMNTRLQVEHPITEMITKQDLVEWQIRVAEGKPLPLSQQQLKIYGHAFEARVYAENPDKGFLPGTGCLEFLEFPSLRVGGPDHVRIDTGVRQGDSVSVYYDPMISKLIVWDHDRNLALRRLKLALENYHVAGLHTNIPFLLRLASHPEFEAGRVDTGFIKRYHKELIFEKPVPVPHLAVALTRMSQILQQIQTQPKQESDPHSPWSLGNGFRMNHEHSNTTTYSTPETDITYRVTVTFKKNGTFIVTVTSSNDPSTTTNFTNVKGSYTKGVLLVSINGEHIRSVVASTSTGITVMYEGKQFELTEEIPSFCKRDDEKGSLQAPMPGKIVKLFVSEGSSVKAGDPLLILEAMKMEHKITSPRNGILKSLHYRVGEIVSLNANLATIE